MEDFPKIVPTGKILPTCGYMHKCACADSNDSVNVARTQVVTFTGSGKGRGGAHLQTRCQS